jgi:Zn finger protein HypA/HybF involved in hydrogenase expression
MKMDSLTPEQLLVKCPQCGAWPMAVVRNEGFPSMERRIFRCPKCNSRAAYSVGVAGTLIPSVAERG